MRIKILIFLSLLFAPVQLALAQHSASLSWVASATQPPPPVTYNVYKGSGACSTSPTMVKVASSISALTYVDTTVTAGATYCYYVKALQNSIESVASTSATAIIPADAPLPPTGLTVVVI